MENFTLNKDKIAAALLYVAENVSGIRFHRLLKIVYFADLKHMSKYGRPITGDTYVAMQDGPVASWLYDLLKKNDGANYWDSFEVSVWFKEVTIKATPNLDFFSDSDIECLKASIEENRNLTFGELKEKSHDFAWKKTGRNGKISIEKLVVASGASDEMKDYLGKRDLFT